MSWMDDEAFAAVWAALTQPVGYRAGPLPLPKRVRAAVDAAAMAGSWTEVLRTRFERGIENRERPRLRRVS
jgi:hypothetical protein